jgi:hypothetical protein
MHLYAYRQHCLFVEPDTINLRAPNFRILVEPDTVGLLTRTFRIPDLKTNALPSFECLRVQCFRVHGLGIQQPVSFTQELDIGA